MTMERGVLRMVFSLAAIALIAGCGSSSKSGTGGASGSGSGGSAAGGSGAGGHGTGGVSGTGGKVDGGGTDAPGDTGTDTPAPKPVCGPYADGGMPSDAGVDASANASFFVTSDTSKTGDLGGLAGADLRCQRLANAVGLGGKTWHAYLSAEHGSNGDGGTGPVNAKDRIGTGPWYNVRGQLVAQDLTALHTTRKGDPTIFIDEHGVMINGQWTGAPTPLEHDVLTGTNADGTVAIGKTCSDWTSSAGIPDGGAPDGGSLFVARVGHTDGLGPNCAAAPAPPNDVTSWNSAHDNAGCNDTAPRGGAGRLYCFATGP